MGCWPRLLGLSFSYRFRPPRIRPLNPIGSGDAMAGGIAHGLREGWELRDAVRLGVACGTANALTLRNGEIRPADVPRIAEAVEIERLP